MENIGIIAGSSKTPDLQNSVTGPVAIALTSGFAWFPGIDGRELCLGPSRFYVSENFPQKGVTFEGATGLWFSDLKLESPEILLYAVCRLDSLSEMIINEIFFRRQSDSADKAAAIALLCRSFRGAELWETVDASAEVGGTEVSVVEQACQFMRDNFDSNPSLEIVARYCNISTRSLTAAFRKNNLPSPMKYLANLKAERARDMLENNDYSISQIATFLGFSEVAAFSHFFRKQTGKSPREFRDDVNWLL